MNKVAVSDEVLAQRLTQPRDTRSACATAQDACQQLYQRYGRLLLAFLSSRVPRADLADVHHEVWVRVWERAPLHFDGQHFRGWLFQVARNYLIDHARRLRPEPMEKPESVPANQVGPLDRLLEEERRSLLERCLQRLESVAAELVRGRLSGETYPDLCSRLEIPPERAHKLFHAAKEQLQSCIERSNS